MEYLCSVAVLWEEVHGVVYLRNLLAHVALYRHIMLCSQCPQALQQLGGATGCKPGSDNRLDQRILLGKRRGGGVSFSSTKHTVLISCWANVFITPLVLACFPR